MQFYANAWAMPIGGDYSGIGAFTSRINYTNPTCTKNGSCSDLFPLRASVLLGGGGQLNYSKPVHAWKGLGFLLHRVRILILLPCSLPADVLQRHLWGSCCATCGLQRWHPKVQAKAPTSKEDEDTESSSSSVSFSKQASRPSTISKDKAASDTKHHSVHSFNDSLFVFSGRLQCLPRHDVEIS